MPPKHLLFRSEAREGAARGHCHRRRGARHVRTPIAVRADREEVGKPIVCNDGVTIAKEFSLKDPEEDLGAQMLRGAAERTGDTVGDGTTTSTILALAIVAEGVRNIAAGASAIDFKRRLDRAARVAPTKVVRLALENAVSVAGILLLTEANDDRGARAEAGGRVAEPRGVLAAPRVLRDRRRDLRASRRTLLSRPLAQDSLQVDAGRDETDVTVTLEDAQH